MLGNESPVGVLGLYGLDLLLPKHLATGLLHTHDMAFKAGKVGAPLPNSAEAGNKNPAVRHHDTRAARAGKITLPLDILLA